MKRAWIILALILNVASMVQAHEQVEPVAKIRAAIAKLTPLDYLNFPGLYQISSRTAYNVRYGPSDPATCVADRGDIFFNTTTDLLKICTATNTWTSLATGGCVPAGSAGQVLSDSGAGACTSNSGLTFSGGVFTVVGSISTNTSVTSPLLVLNGANLSSVSGSGTTVLGSTITSAASGDTVQWDGSKWVNSVVGIPVSTTSSATPTVAAGDKGKLYQPSHASSAITLPQATSTFAAPWYFLPQYVGSGGATITPTTSTINGQTTLTLGPYDGATVVSDSTNYFAIVSRVTQTCSFMLGADNGSALTTSDDQKSICINRSGRTWQIVEAFLQCDATDASTSFNIQNNDGSAANILTSDVTCNSSGTAGSLSATEKFIANGSAIDLLTVTANTAKRLTIVISYR